MSSRPCRDTLVIGLSALAGALQESVTRRRAVTAPPGTCFDLALLFADMATKAQGGIAPTRMPTRRRTRRGFLQGGLATAVGSIASCGGHDLASGAITSSSGYATTGTGDSDGSESTGAGHAGPNIIFITLDDLGWSSLPAYGNPSIQTPAIDSLVQEGLLLRNAFLVTSSCSPSRGVYLTGQYPHTHGLTGLVHRYPDLAIPPDSPTLPRLLADAGYTCGMQGKWHVSPNDPTHFGFHEFLNAITGTTKIGTADVAIDFIRRHRAGPFYLELDFVEPHLPWIEHDGLVVDSVAAKVLDDWMMPDWPEIRDLASRYFSEIRHVDRVLAGVLDTIGELGLWEDTLIVLLSDNGAPFPGNKMTLYDRGVRTPLIVRWPAVIPAGVRSDALVSVIDLPQALAIAATSQRAPFMQGAPDLFDLFSDPSREYSDSIYAEMTYHAHYCPARSVRTARWKYIRNLSEDPWGLGDMEGEPWTQALLELAGHDWLDPRPAVELYDLDADPHEVENLADMAGYEDIRVELHALLLDHASRTGDDEVDLDL